MILTVKRHARENGSFWGYVWLFWGCGGGPEGPGWGNYPSQMWMSKYDKEKFGWCGYLWLHDITTVSPAHVHTFTLRSRLRLSKPDRIGQDSGVFDNETCCL